MITVIDKPFERPELVKMIKERGTDLVKAVVDVERETIAFGGEMHADEEALLLEQGSHQENLWGINLYPGVSDDDWIEFDSMINVRPSQGNRSRGVDDPKVRELIKNIVEKLIV